MYYYLFYNNLLVLITEFLRIVLHCLTFNLSCPEATSLVGNLALHGRYMLASVAYLRDQIQRKPRILQLGMEVPEKYYWFNV